METTASAYCLLYSGKVPNELAQLRFPTTG